MFRFKKNGFTMVELLIVAGILAGLAVVALNLTKLTSKSSAKFQFDTDRQMITNEINGILSNPVTCKTVFHGLTSTGLINAVTSINGKFPSDGSVFGNSKITINNYNLEAISSGVIKLVIFYKNKSIIKETNGQDLISNFVNLNVALDSSNNIDTCNSTASGMASSQWINSGLNIYYSAGNVGIGSVISPRVSLEVSGGILPGPATIGQTCGTSPAGTLAVDTGTSAIIFCKSTGTWASIDIPIVKTCLADQYVNQINADGSVNCAPVAPPPAPPPGPPVPGTINVACGAGLALQTINNGARTCVPVGVATQSCPAGEYVKGFNSSGNIICGPAVAPSVVAGAVCNPTDSNIGVDGTGKFFICR